MKIKLLDSVTIDRLNKVFAPKYGTEFVEDFYDYLKSLEEQKNRGTFSWLNEIATFLEQMDSVSFVPDNQYYLQLVFGGEKMEMYFHAFGNDLQIMTEQTEVL